MLARNSDLEGAVKSVRELEDRFNRKYNYPWVFLNEEPFSSDFKRCAIPRLYSS
jgi:alpha 1,2-mannosyltransferase